MINFQKALDNTQSANYRHELKLFAEKNGIVPIPAKVKEKHYLQKKMSLMFYFFKSISFVLLLFIKTKSQKK